MNESFQPPANGGGHHPFHHLRKMMNQWFDERPLQKLFETLDDYFAQTFAAAYIPIEVKETKHDYQIIVRLPDIKREQISLQWQEDGLQLIIDHHEWIESSDSHGHVYERRHARRRVARLIPFPYPVAEHEVKASFQNGTLTIQLPQKRKYIDID
ncbi:heat-shock protein Hsp20 [[Bacillus] caldolyticus]|uniref:Heat-shock protein Hsp20 n=1 Tax=Bacillus caldolyticus TaxID=1394 RepID=A0ABM6QRK3_BACCL|nr:Hsp20/alpha crystallin family protein [[Bacillus] caldolyticus]AUI38124.1 heat-shock protein Hsp20 [[Bacillus] caldolyticus]